MARVKVRSYKRKTKSGYTIVKSFTRNLIANALAEISEYSPKIIKQKEEVLRRRQLAAKKKEPNNKDRYHIMNSSNRVLSKSHTNKGHKLGPGQYIVDTHKKGSSNNGRKWNRIT